METVKSQRQKSLQRNQMIRRQMQEFEVTMSTVSAKTRTLWALKVNKMTLWLVSLEIQIFTFRTIGNIFVCILYFVFMVVIKDPIYVSSIKVLFLGIFFVMFYKCCIQLTSFIENLLQIISKLYVDNESSYDAIIITINFKLKTKLKTNYSI